jgi:hypothetical protein
MGHRDIFDILLYSTSVTSGMVFLTLDRELIGFIEERGLPRAAVGPEKLKAMLT